MAAQTGLVAVLGQFNSEVVKKASHGERPEDQAFPVFQVGFRVLTHSPDDKMLVGSD